MAGGISGTYAFDSVEVFDGDAWQPGPDMPSAASHHCLVQLNETHTIMMGGTVESRSYILDWPEQKWKSAASMHLERRDHSCVLMSDGKVLVVGGAEHEAASTEIYDPDENQWKYGPSLPFEWSGGGLVVIDNYPTVVGGGGSGPSFVNKPYQLVDHRWMEMEAELENRNRKFHSTTQVPVESLPGCE